jgi:pimeloyl-ACP methyl ester carboxylesterase
MITARTIPSPRLTTRVLTSGADAGTPVIFVHGNLSSADWWRGVMARLPAQYRAIAPDLRAYGGADPSAKVDATRGMRDFSDDLAAMMDALGITAAHLVGHSLGGAVLWQFMADYAGRALSVTQVAPGSPYGFGGCKLDGTPCAPDNAGSGGGAVNPEFARLLAAGDRGDASPFHPLSILNTYVWKPPFVPAEIELLLDATLSQHCGPQDYPGDAAPSLNWPMVAPGKLGPINAMAPIYQTQPLGFLRASCPVLWICGADDPVVSDASLFDLGTLGQLGAVPGWPGADAYPPQPMIAQTTAALAAYAAKGRVVQTHVMQGCGHSPYLEHPAQFDATLHAFLARA